eukprot:3252424-Rhodomonas_salina.5
MSLRGALEQERQRLCGPVTMLTWRLRLAETLELCLKEIPTDRPSLQLLEVMEANDFLAPPSWRGYREVETLTGPPPTT